MQPCTDASPATVGSTVAIRVKNGANDEKGAPEPPYSRMAIPYYLIKQVEEAGTHLRKGTGHFAHQRIDVVQGRVQSLDRSAHQVTLDDGRTLAYDKLLVATGSRPVAPPVPGVDLPGVTACWTLADARRIAAIARPGARVVLMGAGFIGCIILEALAKSGADLTVVEMEGRMVPRMMNDIAGNLIKDWCEQHGVKVHTSMQVTAIERKGGALAVTLKSGATLDADLVVSATGVRPNLALVEGTGIKTDHGILVDRHMQTNDADVYAAGDVAQGHGHVLLVGAAQDGATEAGGRPGAIDGQGELAVLGGQARARVTNQIHLAGRCIHHPRPSAQAEPGPRAAAGGRTPSPRRYSGVADAD